MPIIRHEISIHAPIQVCFDLARTVEVHAGKILLTKQIAIAGITYGLMERGDFVTWETTHLGMKQKLTSQVIEMVKPWFMEPFILLYIHMNSLKGAQKRS